MFTRAGPKNKGRQASIIFKHCIVENTILHYVEVSIYVGIFVWRGSSGEGINWEERQKILKFRSPDTQLKSKFSSKNNKV